jgi:hypothetical protein
MNAAMLFPLMLLGMADGGLAEAREPEPPLDPEEQARRDAEQAAHERALDEARRLREQKTTEFTQAGHVAACAYRMGWGHKCSCPAPFAREPEPAKLEDAASARDHQKIAAAIEKRARKAAKHRGRT